MPKWKRRQKRTKEVKDNWYSLRLGRWESEIRQGSSPMCVLFYEATFRNVVDGREREPIRELKLDTLMNVAYQEMVRLGDWERLK